MSTVPLKAVPLKIRLRIDFGDANAIGPGKIALLERMRDSGSLSQAARELKMSYRRAWQLLESLNTSFREPVVITSIGGKGGGGTTITALGEALIAAYRAFEQETAQRADSYFGPMTAKVARKGASNAARRRPLTKSTRPPAAPKKRGRGSKPL
jgi:molybdate transport system regulatory protein